MMFMNTVLVITLIKAIIAQPPSGGPLFGGPPPLMGPPPPFGAPFPGVPQDGGSFRGPPPPRGQFGQQNGQQSNAFAPNGPPPGQFGPPPQGGQQQGFGGPPNNGFPGGGSQAGPQGAGLGGGPRCRPDQNSAKFPECMQQFFKNGILMDGNGRSCNRQGTISAKIDRNTLLKRAEEIMRTGQCQREQMGPPSGNGGPPPQWGRRKRQMFGQTCSGLGIGNCETRSQRLESIYIEKDLGDKLLIITNGIPNHCYHDGAVAPTPNLACEHYRMMVIPKEPRKLSTFTQHSMGPVGIAKSGAFFYNHKSAEATCAVAAISEKPSFDACDGHCDPMCRYHYHKAPNCMPGFDQCALLGYSNDGFPIYGKCTVDGMPMKSCYRKSSGKNGCDPSHYTFDPSVTGCNLDEANGFMFKKDTVTNGGTRFKAGSYAYFFTPDYPFIMPGAYGNKSKVQWCVITP